MKHRVLGNGFTVSAIGLGCMGMSEFYSPRDDVTAMGVMDRAVDLGVSMFDTADMYGPYHNEELIGRFIATRRPDIKIATKFGIVRNGSEYSRTIDNSAAYARKCCEASLRRLGIEQIDLYYVHRIATTQSIEETMYGLVKLKEEGKIAHIGLCEVSAATLRRAHAVHPVTAVQSEYSLWTRDVEDDVLPTCRQLGIGFVGYSPLGRGFLTGRFQNPDEIGPGDLRAMLPRFQSANMQKNKSFVAILDELAQSKGATPAQIALAWILAQGDQVVPIPGTNSLSHLASNIAAASITLTAQEMHWLSSAVARVQVAGERYTEEGMKGVAV